MIIEHIQFQAQILVISQVLAIDENLRDLAYSGEPSVKLVHH